MGSLTGCSMANGGEAKTVVTADVADSQAVIDTLESAKKITAKKDLFYIGDRWTISADGVEVGEIRGQVIYLLGDTYSLFSKAGNLVGSEAEGYRLLHHRAELYDYNNEPRGEIKQNFSLFLSNYSILDGEGNLTGTASQNFNLTMDFDVLGPTGRTEYSISKALFSFGAAVTVDVEATDRSVDAIDALWLAVIASEVEEAAAQKE